MPVRRLNSQADQEVHRLPFLQDIPFGAVMGQVFGLLRLFPVSVCTPVLHRYGAFLTHQCRNNLRRTNHLRLSKKVLHIITQPLLHFFLFVIGMKYLCSPVYSLLKTQAPLDHNRPNFHFYALCLIAAVAEYDLYQILIQHLLKTFFQFIHSILIYHQIIYIFPL